MTTYLLDANVLIALTVAEHEHHERASAWAANIERFVVSPVVEGALVRFLVRIGESAGAAQQIVRDIHELPRGEFWTDSVSYADVSMEHVLGHRQVTDAYLLALARTHGAFLATFDHALAALAPDDALLVPGA